jgi:hypothetical protein
MRAKLTLAVAVLAAQQAWAGTISIQLTHSAELEDGTLRASLEVRNGGDEAARGVSPRLRFQNAEVRAAATEALAPGEPLEVALETATGELGEGRWPYSILVDYADANLYPFQAVSVGMIEIGAPPLPKLSVTGLTPVKVGDEADLSVTLKNVSDTPQQVELGVVGPEAVEVMVPAEQAALAAWEERTVALRLVNRAALPGSSYPLFVTAQWQDGAVHQAVVAQTTVEIVEGGAAGGRPGPGLWIVGGLVLVGIGFFLFRRSRT